MFGNLTALSESSQFRDFYCYCYTTSFRRDTSSVEASYLASYYHTARFPFFCDVLLTMAALGDHMKKEDHVRSPSVPMRICGLVYRKLFGIDDSLPLVISVPSV